VVHLFDTESRYKIDCFYLVRRLCLSVDCSQFQLLYTLLLELDNLPTVRNV
jgi:hypothetical protein